MKNKLLIISYYFPPCSKSGSQRAIKMAQNLPQFGWKPYILTTKHSKSTRSDNNLVNQTNTVYVRRTKEFYPFKNHNKKTLFSKAWHKFWSFITIIDENVGWIPFAYSAGLKIIKENNITAIFVTGFPFSSFLIGLLLKKKTGLPLFLDYRDPWTSNSAFISHRNRVISKWVENKCLENCDLFFGATPLIVNDTSKDYSKQIKKKGKTFTYSFDPAEFPNPNNLPSSSGKLTIIGMGTVYDKKIGDNLISAIKNLVKNNIVTKDNFNFEFYGSLGINKNFELEINEILKLSSYIPRDQILAKICNSNGLLLPHGSGDIVAMCYPGRLFEYFAVKKPILYIGPKGIAAKTIQKAKIGLVSKEEVEDIENKLALFINKIRTQSFSIDTEYINSFEVQSVIKKFVLDIENLTENKLLSY